MMIHASVCLYLSCVSVVCFSLRGDVILLRMIHTYQVAILQWVWWPRLDVSAVPYWGQPTQNSSSLSPKRDCGPKSVTPGKKTTAIMLKTASDFHLSR